SANGTARSAPPRRCSLCWPRPISICAWSISAADFRRATAVRFRPSNNTRGRLPRHSLGILATTCQRSSSSRAAPWSVTPGFQSEVVLIADKGDGGKRWVYLDVGKFNGLAETIGESIKYRIEVPGRSGPTGPVILAGPTCDSADILYEQTEYKLPLGLEVGDKVEILAAGAYTASYASVGFNGFPPLRTYCI